MSHVTLASLLTDYGVSDDDEPKGINLQAAALSEEDLAPGIGFERLPESSTSALEDAYKRGYEEGQREAEARMAHDLGEQRAAAELKLGQARKTWALEFGQALSQELSSAVKDMHHVLADNFAEVLLPIIRDEMRGEAVRKISAAIRTTAPTDWQGPLLIEGPSDLLTALRENLADMESIIECQPVEGRDVKVTINETILETQLEAWGDAVKRILK